jgi:NADPH:quinone reductase-like Zn-dependent oxidoreductase
MKAIVCHRCGPPNDLAFEDVDRPSPGDGDVLMKVVITV